MAITVEIAGVDRTSLLVDPVDELQWDNQVNGRANISIKIGDDVGGFVPADGQKVEVKESGTRRAWGIIQSVATEMAGPDSASGFLVYDLEIGGYEYLIEKRLVFRRYGNKAIGTIVADLNTNAFNGEGLTVGVDAITGVDSLTEAFNGDNGAMVMDRLCELADDGRAWWIDESLVIQCRKPGFTATPATITADNIALTEPVPRVWTDKSTYRNVQYVRGEGGAEGDFPILAAYADSSEVTTRAAAELGSGRYERLDDRPEIRRIAHARSAAEAIVTTHSPIPTMVKFRTRVAGFEPGQQGTVNLPNLGLSSVTMYVETVAVSVEPDRQAFQYVVTMTNGNPRGSWRQYWRHRRRYPPQARLWEEPEDDKPKRRERKRRPQVVYSAGRGRRDGHRGGIPRGGRSVAPVYSADGVRQLVDPDNDAITANLKHKSGGTPLERSFMKASEATADDLDGVPDGTTNARVLASYLDANRPKKLRRVTGAVDIDAEDLFDMTREDLDNISDGTVNAKVLASYLDANRPKKLRRAIAALDVDADDVFDTTREDLGDVADDAGGTWRKVASVNASNKVVGNSCSLSVSILSSSVGDGGFVNVNTGGGSLEAFYDLDTDARFEAFSHSTSRSSWKNTSGSSQGYSITRTFLDTS